MFLFVGFQGWQVCTCIKQKMTDTIDSKVAILLSPPPKKKKKEEEGNREKKVENNVM